MKHLRDIGLIVGGILGCSALMLDAWAAHGLHPLLSPHDFDSMTTAIRYQQIHAVLLVIIMLVRTVHDTDKAALYLDSAAVCFMAGCLLFCGAIYIGILADMRIVLHVVPAGGMTLMLGWLMLAFAGFRLSRS